MLCGGTYSVILVDPPWHYANQNQHNETGKSTGGVADKYLLMQQQELFALGPWLRQIADPEGCALFCWFPAPHMHHAVDLIRAWRFKYKTLAFVWQKDRPVPGHYTLSQTEFVAVATLRKRPRPFVLTQRQGVEAPRGEHSEKPEEVRKRIEAMYPSARRLELFARGEQQGGWTKLGLDCSPRTLITPTGPKPVTDAQYLKLRQQAQTSRQWLERVPKVPRRVKSPRRAA